VATTLDRHVYPDVFVRAGEDWYILFRDDADGYLCTTTAATWQIQPQDILEDPAFGSRRPRS
jgi:hypothetical protein